MVYYVDESSHQLFLNKLNRQLTLSSITAYYELILIDLRFSTTTCLAIAGVIGLVLGLANAISIQVSRNELEKTSAFSCA
jgi:hypothetical protein